MNIGDRVREERERLGYDQEGFSALGGASRHSQIDWEKGKSFPNAKVLAAFAAAGADVQYILTGVRAAAASAVSETGPGYTVISVTQREAALLDNYRHVPEEEDKRAIDRMALLAAHADPNETQSGKKSQMKKTG